MMSDPHRLALQAKARAEIAAAVARVKNARAKLGRSKDGSYAERKSIAKAGQIVIPAHIVKRWAEGIGASEDGLISEAADSTAGPVPVLVLDLGWGVVVVPAHEARQLVRDLGLAVEATGDLR